MKAFSHRFEIEKGRKKRGRGHGVPGGVEEQIQMQKKCTGGNNILKEGLWNRYGFWCFNLFLCFFSYACLCFFDKLFVFGLLFLVIVVDHG